MGSTDARQDFFFRPNDGSCNAFKLDLSTDQSLRSLRLERYLRAARGQVNQNDPLKYFFLLSCGIAGPYRVKMVVQI